MASTLSLLTATKYMSKYRLVSDGVNDAVITQAQMVADSPIRSYLGELLRVTDKFKLPYTPAEWAALPDSQFLSIYVLPRSTTAGAVFVQIGPDLVMRVPACAMGEATIELRFIHSQVR